ncbi:MAG: hypothetical protein K8L99_11195 [Anaerolineae bacterium]|nr:hypothetical protein [Anaerolineae bacterium]
MLEKSALDNGLFRYRHWSPVSEQYAGGDALYSFLMTGWEIATNVVFYEEIWLNGVRRICICHIELKKDDQIIEMPVLENPYVHKMLVTLRIQQLPVDKAQRRLAVAEPL